MPLKQGSSGPAVRELQGNLRSAGAQLKADGIFGPQTEAAVRQFQQRHGLVADGVVGVRSWSALHRSRPASPGFDPFDPEDYAQWLAESAQGALRSIGGIFGTGGGTAAAGGARPAAAPLRRQAATPAPRAANGPRSNDAPPPPQVSPSQNRQHNRISFAGYEGRGFVALDYEKYTGWEVQLCGRRIVRPFQGGIRNECAQFVQLFGVPNTRSWRRGPQVCHMAPGSLPVGTVVATLRDGTYHSDYSGRSHVGLYLGHDSYDPAKGNSNAGGVTLLDQYNGARIARRPKMYSKDADEIGKVAKRAWTDGAGHRQTHRVSWTSDGEEYFVLMVR